MLEKIKAIYDEILKKAEKTQKSDEEFVKLSVTEMSDYLREQSYINGQLSIIQQVIQIIRQGE